SRHTNIHNQTAGLVLRSGLQELLRRSKAARRKSFGFDQILQCILDRLVVIDDRNQFRVLVGGHKTILASGATFAQSRLDTPK
ncbi:MAG TPA: hypothetical protein VE242_05320, partial [Chthoniobacterales bacterium]|nr:hypothetical protein [Chthoniobacterales bacterium]